MSKPYRVSVPWEIEGVLGPVEVTLEATCVPADQEGRGGLEDVAVYRWLHGRYVRVWISDEDFASAVERLQEVVEW